MKNIRKVEDWMAQQDGWVNRAAVEAATGIPKTSVQYSLKELTKRGSLKARGTTQSREYRWAGEKQQAASNGRSSDLDGAIAAIELKISSLKEVLGMLKELRGPR